MTHHLRRADANATCSHCRVIRDGAGAMLYVITCAQHTEEREEVAL